MKKTFTNHSGAAPQRSGATAERRHSVSGFSLVELIFAIILLTVIVFGVVKLQTSNLALTNTQKNELQAHFLANEGAEIVEAIGYAYISGGLGPCPTTSAPCTCKITNTSGYDLDCTSGDFEAIDFFERTVELDPTDLTDAYKATILIEWTDSTGQHRRDVDTDGDGNPDNAQVEAKRIIFLKT